MHDIIEELVIDSIRVYELTKKELLIKTIEKIIDEANSKVVIPLTNFVVLGYTPYFNDGEECEHNSYYALKHFVINDSVVDYSNDFDDCYSLIQSFYPNYSDIYDLINDIKFTVIEPTIAYKSKKDEKILNSALKNISELVEHFYTTNYRVTYIDSVLKIESYEPEY